MNNNLLGRLRAALIDMDGVLYDSMPGHTLAWQRLMKQQGVDCTREEFYLYEGMTGPATIDMLFRRAFGRGCGAEEAAELYAIKTRYFRELGPAKPMPGASRMLAALERAGLRRVLVTGSGQKSLLDNLDRDYPGAFCTHLRVTAHDVSHGKPDPEPYLLGARKAGVAPERAIVIENAPLGVRAGKAAGCFTVAVTTGPIPREEFEKEGADMIFPSMEAFADFLEEEIERSDELSMRIRAKLSQLDPDRVFLLTDSNVRRLVPLDDGFADEVMELEPGERSKDIATVCRIWEWLSGNGATRRSVLVNFGGGVVSDIGGFAAATFKRGIRFINVPTTLLAAADAAIGGKTGIDFCGLKNEVGAFAMPEAVILSSRVLSSLPRRELLSGFAEVVKMAIISDLQLYDRLAEEDALTDPELLDVAMRHAARAKEEIVAKDPKESGLRRMLNFGHTMGHAYESLAMRRGTPVTHGEAVAHGILYALQESHRLHGYPEREVKRYKTRILDRYYRPLPFDPEEPATAAELRLLMSHDKKAATAAPDSDPPLILLDAKQRPIF